MLDVAVHQSPCHLAVHQSYVFPDQKRCVFLLSFHPCWWLCFRPIFHIVRHLVVWYVVESVSLCVSGLLPKTSTSGHGNSVSALTTHVSFCSLYPKCFFMLLNFHLCVLPPTPTFPRPSQFCPSTLVLLMCFPLSLSLLFFLFCYILIHSVF